MPQAIPEKNSFPLDVCAAAEKKIPYFRRVITTVVKWIKTEEDFAAGSQMMLQIAEKKIPFRRSPAFFCGMIKIKVRREPRYPIELLAEVWKRLKSVDLINDSLHAKQLQ